MASKTELQIILQAKDQASAVVANLNKTLSLMSTDGVKTIKTLSERFDGFADNAKRVGTSLSGFVTAPILGLGAAVIKIGSDFEETENRFNQVFGSMADEAGTFATEFSSTVGRSIIEVQNAMASFQSIAVGLGFPKEQAAAFSQELEKMVVDFASFNNIADQESADRFRAALSGSAEVLDQFGVNLRSANLDLKLAELGFNTVAEGATEAQKTIARMEIIREVMGEQGAMGDAIKTSGSFANQMKALKSDVDELAISIRDILLPIATKVVAFAKSWVERFRNMDDETKQTILTILGVAAVTGPLILAIGGVVKAVTTMIKIWSIISKTILVTNPYILLVVGVLFALDRAIKASGHTWADVWNGIIDIVQIAVNNIVEIINGFIGVFNKFGANIGQVSADLSGFKMSTDGANQSVETMSQSTEQATDSGFDLDKMLGSLSGTMGGAGGSATKAADEFQDAMVKMHDSGQTAANAINDAFSDVEKSIASLQQRLSEAGVSRAEDTQSAQEDLARAFVEAQDQVESVRAQIAKETDATTLASLRDTLAQREAELRGFGTIEMTLQGEISAARQAADNSDLQNAISGFQKRLRAIDQEFEKTKTTLEAQIVTEQTARDQILAIRAAAEKQAEQFTITQESATVESINRQIEAYNQLGKAIANARSGGSTPLVSFTDPVPKFAQGGVVSGPIGAPQMAMVHGGERIIPAGKSSRDIGGSGLTINVSVTGNNITDQVNLREFAMNVGEEIFRNFKGQTRAATSS